MDTFLSSVWKNNLPMLQWLYEHGLSLKQIRKNIRSLCYSCTDLNILQQLREQGHSITDFVLASVESDPIYYQDRQSYYFSDKKIRKYLREWEREITDSDTIYGWQDNNYQALRQAVEEDDVISLCRMKDLTLIHIKQSKVFHVAVVHNCLKTMRYLVYHKGLTIDNIRENDNEALEAF